MYVRSRCRQSPSIHVDESPDHTDKKIITYSIHLCYFSVTPCSQQFVVVTFLHHLEFLPMATRVFIAVMSIRSPVNMSSFVYLFESALLLIRNALDMALHILPWVFTENRNYSVAKLRITSNIILSLFEIAIVECDPFHSHMMKNMWQVTNANVCILLNRLLITCCARYSAQNAESTRWLSDYVDSLFFFSFYSNTSWVRCSYCLLHV